MSYPTSTETKTYDFVQEWNEKHMTKYMVLHKFVWMWRNSSTWGLTMSYSWRDRTLCDKVCQVDGLLHQENWLPRYGLNIAKTGVKHYNLT
jgi:hypothetical protein